MKLDLTSDVESQERAAHGEAPFEQSAFYDKLGELREHNPQAFSSLSPAPTLTLAYYEGAKRRANSLKDETA